MDLHGVARQKAQNGSDSGATEDWQLAGPAPSVERLFFILIVLIVLSGFSVGIFT